MPKKIDMKQPLMTLDGSKALTRMEDSDDVLTLGDVCVHSLLEDKNNGEGVSGEAKCQHMILAMSIHNSDEPVGIATSDIAHLKKLITAVWTSPLVVGQSYKMLDAASEE